MYFILYLICACALSSMQAAEKTTYAAAGVNINTSNAFVDRIAPLVKTTTRPGADAELGGFGGFFDIAKLKYKDPIIVSTTDGVGTKLKLAQLINKHDTIGIDLVAMNVNDLIVHGAEPLFFLDYFATSALDIEQAVQVVEGIVRGCQISNCALTGGETAQMPGMYRPHEYDLAGFAVGIVERSQLLPKLNDIKNGDVVLGLASSGIHSNGFSLVRSIIEKNNVYIFAPPPFASQHARLCDLLLEPTTIYVKSLLPLIKTNHLKALAHITGGGLCENIPRILPAALAVELDMSCWKVPPVFSWLAQVGNVESAEMIRTFNLGIGMVVIVAQEHAHYVQQQLEKSGETVFTIGRVVPLPHNGEHVIITNISI